MHFQRSLDPKPVVNKSGWYVTATRIRESLVQTRKSPNIFFFFVLAGIGGTTLLLRQLFFIRAADFVTRNYAFRYAKLRVTP